MRRAAIFRLRRHGEVEVSPGPNGAGDETHRAPSYDLDTSSDALENQIGPSVWPLQCNKTQTSKNGNLGNWLNQSKMDKNR